MADVSRFKKGLPRWWEWLPPFAPFFGLLYIDSRKADGTDWGAFGFLVGILTMCAWLAWLAVRGYFDKEDTS